MKKILVIIVGIIFIGVGIFVLVRGNELAKRCTVEAIGTVVELKEEESTDSDGFTDYTYYPIIEYNVGDNTVTKQSDRGSNPAKYNINDKVEILYNPNNVEEYIIKGNNDSNIFGIVFIILGAIVIILGIIKRI